LPARHSRTSGGDGATTAASRVSAAEQVIPLLVATEGGEAVILGKVVCTTLEKEHTIIPSLTTHSAIVISETYTLFPPSFSQPPSIFAQSKR